MEKLDDSSIAPIELFDKLSVMAAASGYTAPVPGATADNSSQATGTQAPSSPPSPSYSTGKTMKMKRTELGPLDMEKYLNNYGIRFDVKDDGNKTLYRLDKCLFNPDHGPNEASIVVPRQGAILYQCFHASCKAQTWKAARTAISGDKSLAEFCQGYDPNWTPEPTTGTGIMAALPTPMLDAQALRNGIGGGPPVPPPDQVNSREFFEKKGKRPVFVPNYLTKYLAAYLHPICNTNGFFYHYANGVWAEVKESMLGQIIHHALKDDVQASWIENGIKLLRNAVNREESEWPQHINLVNLKNTMLDLDTKNVLPHSPHYGSRTQLPVNYNPDAGWSELWVNFLRDVFPDDLNYEKRTLLQQYFGYVLLRDVRFHKALFMIGSGANGKSTVIEVLSAMVGEDNTSNLAMHELQDKFRAHFLMNKLVNMASETNTRDPMVMDIFKKVVAGDQIQAERKYVEVFKFRPYAKWIISMNEAPVITDKTYGFQRRVDVLEFTKRFTEEERIPDMYKLLVQEIDGVFNWAVDGLFALLQNNRFTAGPTINQATEKIMETMNPFLIFANECLEVHDGINESTTRLWNAYKAWCADGRNRPLGRNKFLEQVTLTFTRVKKCRPREEGSQEIRFDGIKLNSLGQDYAEKGAKMTGKLFGGD